MNNHDPEAGPHALASEMGDQAMAAARIDLLSQMLTLIRLRGELVYSADLTSPWSLRFSPGAAYFYVVSEGEITVQVQGGELVHAVAGDLLMLPHGREHLVFDAPDITPVAIRQLISEQFTTERLSVRHGGNGALTKLIVGVFRFESQAMTSIMAALPAIILIPKTSGSTQGWLEGLAHFMLEEAHAPNPGASLMISRLIDVLVIRTLRTWAQSEQSGTQGWLGALSDSRISRVLKAIHDEPFKDWSVLALARLAGMSRSSFAERFSTLVGEAPLHYQTRWRLTLAMDLLRQSDIRVSDAARHVGYDSDAAFSRAFKAQFGLAPSEMSRQQ